MNATPEVKSYIKFSISVWFCWPISLVNLVKKRKKGRMGKMNKIFSKPLCPLFLVEKSGKDISRIFQLKLLTYFSCFKKWAYQKKLCPYYSISKQLSMLYLVLKVTKYFIMFTMKNSNKNMTVNLLLLQIIPHDPV